MTPFGSPVVPLEYGSTTTSSAGLIDTAGGSGGASSRSLNERTPGAASPNMNISSTPAAAAASFALSRNGAAVTIKRGWLSFNCLVSSAAVHNGFAVVTMPPTSETALKTTPYSGTLWL